MEIMRPQLPDHEGQLNRNCQSEVEDKKYYSILPDLATGWRPRNLKIAAPIIITFEETLNQSVYDYYTGFMNKLVYIGPRHENSYKFHSLTQHAYTIKYGLKYEEVPSKLQKELEQFTLKKKSRKSPFQGMNPYLPSQLKFDSNFESGNLDLVAKVSQKEYNLFLRPDTNTQGHMQWFYFKVINHPRCETKTVKFNICNNKKAFTLFRRGMKPFVKSKYLEESRGLGWHQAGTNVTYDKLSTNEMFSRDIINVRTEVGFTVEELDKYQCLSFEYTFENQNDEVYFAYCPPFTYSEMKEHVSSLKKKTYKDITCSLTEEVLCSSMSGLEIPVLTITDQAYSEQSKKCVVAMARIHPGESNGSHVMKGFLEFLVSGQAEQLRKKIIFKVIPMINPDGVVFGNYRTGLSGKDLNRKFKAKSQELFPEIIYLKEFVSKLKKESPAKMVYFLDFHGHSMKKNVFTYGPEYDLWTGKYEKSKVLPRMLALKTNMFRLQSCLFRVALGKKTTARAFMLSMIPYCYTIQSSVGLFRSFEQGCNHCFDPLKWVEMGIHIGQGLRDAISKVFDDMSLKQKDKIKKKNSPKIITPIIKSRIEVESADQNNKENLDEDSKPIKRINSSVNLPRSISNRSIQGKKEVETTKNIKVPITSMSFQIPQINQVQEKQEESDGYSEGKSDCESDDNDLNKESYKHLSGKIMKFIESFNNSIIGLKRNKIRIKYKPKKRGAESLNKSKTGKTMSKKGFNEELKFVPSLKHKFIKREFSEKKINTEDKDFSILKANKISLYKHEEDRRRKKF